MKNNKVSLIVLVIIVLLVGTISFLSFQKSKNGIVFKNTDNSGSIKDKVEKYLFEHLSKDSTRSFSFADKKACSFLLYGYDEKYIYGYGLCETIISENNGAPSIGSELADPLRLSYLKPDFKITSYEIPTSMCPECKGTTPKDILPASYYERYIREVESDYSMLEKGNLEKFSLIN